MAESVYPKWKHSPEREPILVHSVGQEEALEGVWYDHPAHFPTEADGEPKQRAKPGPKPKAKG